MLTPFRPYKNELESAYFAQNRRNREELIHLTIHDQMITKSMSGALPEQTAPANFLRLAPIQMEQADFLVTWKFVAAWGRAQFGGRVD